MPSYYLECVSGSLKGKTVRLRPGRAVTFGRDQASTARIHDRKLSRIHCQFEIVEGDVVLTDLNSTNGTFVNNERIDEVKLFPGDTIQLGRVNMVLKVEGKAQREPAASAEDEDTAAEFNIAGRCRECGGPVAQEDLDAGRARRARERMYCAGCAAQFTPRPGEEGEENHEPTPESVETVGETLEPGAVFAGVRILERIGSGRIGPVYLAEQAETGRRVALKLIEVGSEKAARRYLDAIYASGQLVHSNITLLYDSGEENGVFYVIREHVDGESLESLLERVGALPVGNALDVAVQVVEALRYARERHIGHGGVAPANVLLTNDGTVKLTDFGVETLVGEGLPDPREDMSLLPYLAPELVRQPSSSVDFAADCYSVGALFFRMLAGQPPLTADTPEGLRERLESASAPPLADFVEDAPAEAVHIVERCLNKMPNARYQRPRELLYELEENLRPKV